MKTIIKLSLCSIFLLGTGCSSLKSELGLDRHTPDEFTVMQRAPLEIPSDLTTLPTPQPGMPRPQDVTAKQLAEAAIRGGAQPTQQAPSAAESTLMKKAGAGAVDADIRQKITAESKEQGEDKRPVVKRIFGLGDHQANTKAVDAEAEAKRIQDAKKSGKPITEGETPSIED